MSGGKTCSATALPRIFILLLMTTTALSEGTAAQDHAVAPQPPVAKKEPKVTEIHGHRLVDNYFWLRDKKNPEVAAYLQAENAYADSVMKPTEPFQKQLYGEMLGRIKQTDVNVPYKEGNYFYYSRTEQGKQYPIHCRKKGSVERPEEIVLDVNQLAAGQSFMVLGAYRPSDDGSLLAYSTDNTGFRQYTLRIKDLVSGKLLPDHMEKTGSVAWANDNRSLFYTVEDAAKRQYRLYRHQVGATAPDELVYEEKDEMFSLSAHKSRSNAFIFLISASHTTSEARYLRADQPEGKWKLMAARVAGQEYYPDHNGSFFYIRTNDAGRNFRLVKAPLNAPDRKNWQEVLPHRADVMLEGADFFRNVYVLEEREAGLPQMRITDLRTGQWHRMQLPEAAYSASPEVNREYDTGKFRYRYQSFITSPSVYDYDMEKRASKLLKQTEVLGGYDPRRYQSERIYATARDGVKVPISLVYLKELKRDGTAPIYLYAYGSYGIPLQVTFNSNRFSLIDRGAVYAVAHIRGGGDLGKSWHDDGRMMQKKNTFTDFIAAAEYLLAQEYGARERLVIEGGSAGGLLMGAVTNMRADLFKAVVSKVPFVDLINTMLDESLPLTVGEFQEWGNPKKPEEYDYMMSYSPYDNLEAKTYPAMLVKTSFNDSQVMYWEPAKYVAKLRSLKTDNHALLLKTNMGAGHGGASGRYDALHEAALDYAFILTQMGIDH